MPAKISLIAWCVHMSQWHFTAIETYAFEPLQ